MLNNFQNKTYFRIQYCHNNKMYDFTIFNSSNDEILYHYHFSNIKQINKIIQNFK